jgi:putative FmdB family regulatory protein
MPIYEYRCSQCAGQFQKLVQGFADPPGLACPRCASLEVRRMISRVAVLRSEESRAESLADPSMFAGLDENDPKAIASWAKKLGKELGEEAGDDWNEMVDQMLEEEMDRKPGDDDADGSEAPQSPKPSLTTGAGDNLGWA